jgi:hypothetical protein
MMAQSTLVVEGWNVGFNKVEFTKLLQKELGLSLSSAKGFTDQVLDGKQVAIDVPQQSLGSMAAAVQELGARVSSGLVEDSCQ